MFRSSALVALLAMTSTAFAEVPTQLQHQGRLFTGGVALTGNNTVEFSLYDTPSGGSELWSETLALDFDNGYFSTILGETSPIDAATVDLEEVYLEIAVNSGPPLPQRQRLNSVPYALLAEWADTATNVDGGVVNASEIQIDGNTVIDSTGAVVGDVSWDDLTDVPSDITDGDSTIADGLSCIADDVIRYDGSTWSCVPDNDHTHSAADIAAGVLDIARLPVGGSSTDVAAGDHLHPEYSSTSHTHANYADSTHGHSDYALLTDLPSGGAGALIASFDLDESSAPFVDAAGGNDLTQPGGGLAAGSLGHSGDAVSFSGGVLTAASGNSIPDSPVVTVEMWIQPTTNLNGTQTLFNKEGGYELQQIDGVPRFSVTTGEGTCTVDHTLSTSIGSWYHISAYYNGRIAAVVLNGTEAIVDCTNGPISPTDGDPLWVGAESGSRAEPFLGSVDELRVWGVAPLQSLVEAAPDPGTDDSSCKAILDAGNSTGDGTYTIDVDGPGPTLPRDVHCDMGNGGWTYAAPGVPFRLNYTGGVQTVLTPNRDTLFEITTYGAASGLKLTANETPIVTDGSSPGGSAMGRKTFSPSTTLYMYVGGQGMGANYVDSGQCMSQLGGWNGGGRGSRAGAGGGGASDVRLVMGDLYSRILVGGGGGGCAYGGTACDYNGGNGGGLTAANGQTSAGGRAGGRGGTQTAGGLDGMNTANGAGGFGYGGDAVQCNDEGGGGGGWYGGGSGGEDNRTGGGGSSYIDGMDSDTAQTPGVRYGNGSIEYIFQ